MCGYYYNGIYPVCVCMCVCVCICVCMCVCMCVCVCVCIVHPLYNHLYALVCIIMLTSTCFVGIQLSFTLLNSDPASLHTQWNIEQAIDSKYLFVCVCICMCTCVRMFMVMKDCGCQSYMHVEMFMLLPLRLYLYMLCVGLLQPFLRHQGISSLGSFHIESQVLCDVFLFHILTSSYITVCSCFIMPISS